MSILLAVCKKLGNEADMRQVPRNTITMSHTLQVRKICHKCTVQHGPVPLKDLSQTHSPPWVSSFHPSVSEATFKMEPGNHCYLLMSHDWFCNVFLKYSHLTNCNCLCTLFSESGAPKSGLNHGDHLRWHSSFCPSHNMIHNPSTTNNTRRLVSNTHRLSPHLGSSPHLFYSLSLLFLLLCFVFLHLPFTSSFDGLFLLSFSVRTLMNNILRLATTETLFCHQSDNRLHAHKHKDTTFKHVC